MTTKTEPTIEEIAEVAYPNGYEITQVNMTVSAKMNLGNYENVDHAINVTFKIDSHTTLEQAVNHLRPRMQTLLRAHFSEVFSRKLETKQRQSEWKDTPLHIQTWLKDIADMAQFVAAMGDVPIPEQQSFLNGNHAEKDTTYAD